MRRLTEVFFEDIEQFDANFMFKQALYMNGMKCTVKTLFLGLFNACFECSVRHIGYLSRIFPKAGRIGKSFLVLLGCPSGRYYLGTTVCQGLLPSRRHFEKREDPGDEVASLTIPPLTEQIVGSGNENARTRPRTNLVQRARAHLRSAGSKCHGLWDNPTCNNNNNNNNNNTVNCLNPGVIS